MAGTAALALGVADGEAIVLGLAVEAGVGEGVAAGVGGAEGLGDTLSAGADVGVAGASVGLADWQPATNAAARVMPSRLIEGR